MCGLMENHWSLLVLEDLFKVKRAFICLIINGMIQNAFIAEKDILVKCREVNNFI